MQLAWILPSLVIGAYLGATTGSWYMLGMSGMSALVAWAVKQRQAYQLDPLATISSVGKRHYLGEKKLPRSQLFWRRQWADAAWLHIKTQHEQKLNQQRLGDLVNQRFSMPPGFGVWLGLQSGSDVCLRFEAQAPHLIVVGPTGSGKSELCRLLAMGLVHGEGYQLAFIDFKGGATFNFLKSHPKVVGMATDLEDHKLFSAGLTAELLRREQIFAAAGVANIDEYQRSAQLARLLVFVDEATAYIRSSQTAADLIEAVATRGRSLGVHLILATQTLTGLPRQVLANLRLRIAVGDADPVDLMQLGLHARKTPQGSLPVAGWAQAKLLDENSRLQVFVFPLGATQIYGSM